MAGRKGVSPLVSAKLNPTVRYYEELKKPAQVQEFLAEIKNLNDNKVARIAAYNRTDL